MQLIVTVTMTRIYVSYHRQETWSRVWTSGGGGVCMAGVGFCVNEERERERKGFVLMGKVDPM